MDAPVDRRLPPSPFELTQEEIEERLAGLEQPVRGILEEMWRTAPMRRVTTEALVDAPSFATLYATASALNEDELRWATLSLVGTLNRLWMSPAQFAAWDSPEIFGEDVAP